MSKKEISNTPLPDLGAVLARVFQLFDLKPDDLPLKSDSASEKASSNRFLELLKEMSPCLSEKQIKKIQAQVFQRLSSGSGNHTHASGKNEEQTRSFSPPGRNNQHKIIRGRTLAKQWKKNNQ